MRNVQGYPPNYATIKEILNPPSHAIFCWGDIIYNPEGTDIRQDLVKHEETHERQQAGFGSVELWWNKYLYDSDFRLNQEIEAYGTQWKFLKDLNPPNRIAKMMLQEITSALCKTYDLDIRYGEAESKIRNYAKSL